VTQPTQLTYATHVTHPTYATRYIASIRRYLTSSGHELTTA
jgi:hypothetical protein